MCSVISVHVFASFVTPIYLVFRSDSSTPSFDPAPPLRVDFSFSALSIFPSLFSELSGVFDRLDPPVDLSMAPPGMRVSFSLHRLDRPSDGCTTTRFTTFLSSRLLDVTFWWVVCRPFSNFFR